MLTVGREMFRPWKPGRCDLIPELLWIRYLFDTSRFRNGGRTKVERRSNEGGTENERRTIELRSKTERRRLSQITVQSYNIGDGRFPLPNTLWHFMALPGRNGSRPAEVADDDGDLQMTTEVDVNAV